MGFCQRIRGEGLRVESRISKFHQFLFPPITEWRSHEFNGPLYMWYAHSWPFIPQQFDWASFQWNISSSVRISQVCSSSFMPGPNVILEKAMQKKGPPKSNASLPGFRQTSCLIPYNSKSSVNKVLEQCQQHHNVIDRLYTNDLSPTDDTPYKKLHQVNLL